MQKKGSPKIDADVLEFVDSLFAESDRGCVIVASSHLEESLASLLHAHFASVSKANKSDIEELLHGPLAPIQNFSVRIKACYVLGLITKDMRDELVAFKSVRNAFTHGEGRKAKKRIHKLRDDHVDPVVAHLKRHKKFDVALNAVNKVLEKNETIGDYSRARIRLTVALCVLDGTLIALTKEVRRKK